MIEPSTPQSRNENRNDKNTHAPYEDTHVTPKDTYTILKHLSHHLNTAVDATVHALKRSDGDNRTLAEKLSRFARDIEGSRERVFKKRGEAAVLMTELEMLAVLLKRHGGESSSSPVEMVKVGEMDEKVIDLSDGAKGEGLVDLVGKEGEVEREKKGKGEGRERRGREL